MQRFAAFRRIVVVAAAAAATRMAGRFAVGKRARRLDGALAAIAAYAPAAMAYQGTPGLSIAITDRTKTLAVLTLGYANVEPRRR